MRAKLLLSLLLFTCLAHATVQNVVAIYPLQGEVALFAFADQPELTYTATDLVLTTTQTSVQYPISNLRKVAFEQADIATGLDDIQTSKQFAFRDGQIIIEGGTPNALVNVYTIQGALVSQYRLDGDGNGTISTTGYSGAAYILTTGSITFKFMQP